MTLSRTSGLLLLVMGALTFLGTTNMMLPAVAFFPGVAVCVLGLIVFLKGQPPTQDGRAAQGGSREPRPGGAHHDGREGELDSASLAALEGREARFGAGDTGRPRSDLVLDEAGPAGEADSDFVVSSDVSVPLELQEQSALADQIAKLRRLADDGIISEEELAVAKAKLLK